MVNIVENCYFDGPPPKPYDSWEDFFGSEIYSNVYIRSLTEDEKKSFNNDQESKN